MAWRNKNGSLCSSRQTCLHTLTHTYCSTLLWKIRPLENDGTCTNLIKLVPTPHTELLRSSQGSVSKFEWMGQTGYHGIKNDQNQPFQRKEWIGKSPPPVNPRRRSMSPPSGWRIQPILSRWIPRGRPW